MWILWLLVFHSSFIDFPIYSFYLVFFSAVDCRRVFYTWRIWKWNGGMVVCVAYRASSVIYWRFYNIWPLFNLSTLDYSLYVYLLYCGFHWFQTIFPSHHSAISSYWKTCSREANRKAEGSQRDRRFVCMRSRAVRMLQREERAASSK